MRMMAYLEENGWSGSVGDEVDDSNITTMICIRKQELDGIGRHV